MKEVAEIAGTTQQGNSCLLTRVGNGEPLYEIAGNISISTGSQTFLPEENLFLKSDISNADRQKRTTAVILAFNNGMQVRDIAKYFKLTKPRVRFLLRSNGIRADHPRLTTSFTSSFTSLSDNTIKEINELYFNNSKVTEIARRYGLKTGMVYKILKGTDPLKAEHKQQIAARLQEQKLLEKQTLKNQMIDYLKQKALQLGRLPVKKDILKDPQYCYMRYYRQFGSFRKATVLAGFAQEREGRKREREQKRTLMSQEMQRLYQLAGSRPGKEFIEANCRISFRQFINEFGTLEMAWRKAKLPASIRKADPFYSNEKILDHLRLLHQQFGRAPHISELTFNGVSYSHVLYAKRFGSYNKALIAAGLTPFILYSESRNRNKEIYKLYEDGKSPEELAEIYSLKKNKINHIIHLQRPVKVKDQLKAYHADVCQRYQQGESFESLMSYYRTPKQYIKNILLRNGIPFPKSHRIKNAV